MPLSITELSDLLFSQGEKIEHRFFSGMSRRYLLKRKLMTIQTILKDLRLKKRLTHQDMADQLCMSRSAFSKLELGNTVLTFPALVSISKVLQVPITEIIAQIYPAPGEAIRDSVSVESVADKLSWMLYLTYSTLAETNFTAVPYEELQPRHFAYLMPFGYTAAEAYESTPLRGRVYEFGPKEAYQQIFQHFGMAVLFEENMIQDEHWLEQWQRYKARDYPEVEIDRTDYFAVYVIMLTMPGGTERMVQAAARDFTETGEEDEMLYAVVAKTGAVSGEFLGVTFDGYDPVTEIIR